MYDPEFETNLELGPWGWKEWDLLETPWELSLWTSGANGKTGEGQI